MIILPVRQIEIINSNKATRPGSIGYVALMLHTNGPDTNLLTTYSIFTRYGKGGMRRLDLVRSVSECVSLSDYCEENNLEQFRSLVTREFRLLPRGYSTDVAFKYIEMPKDLSTMDTWEFLGYLSALSLFVSRYEIARKVGGRNTFRHYSVHEMMTLNINDIPVSKLCDFIIGANAQNDEPQIIECVVDYFSYRENRERVLRRVHKLIAKHYKAIDHYMSDFSETKKRMKIKLESAAEMFFVG